MKQLIIAFLLLIFLSVSGYCAEIYSGNFYGASRGEWGMVIESNGYAKIVLYSRTFASMDAVTGMIVSLNGHIQGETLIDGTEIDGQVNSSNSVSGTWYDPYSIVSGTWSGTLQKNVAQYAGVYAGTLPGGANSSWSMTIDTSGMITGFMSSSLYGYFSFEGGVNDDGKVFLGAMYEGLAYGTIKGDSFNGRAFDDYGEYSFSFSGTKKTSIVTTKWYADIDNDGYGDPNNYKKASSKPFGYVSNKTDCDDNDRTIHPGATEIRGDGIDQDCNGKDLASLTTYYLDNDGDGYGDSSCSIESVSRPSGYIGNSKDCNDADSSIYPGATEVWNGIDDDCDGEIDEGVTLDGVKLISPSGISNDAKPTLKWERETEAIWYKVLVRNDDQKKIYSEWFQASDVCPGWNCKVTLSNDLPDDNYQWWVKSWNEQGSTWSDGASFMVGSGYTLPAKVIHVTPNQIEQDLTPTFTWEHDPVSTWYKLWIGYPDGERVFAQWYDANNICSFGDCSVAIETELIDGNYEWYIKSWNDYGKVWSDGMSFTVE